MFWLNAYLQPRGLPFDVFGWNMEIVASVLKTFQTLIQNGNSLKFIMLVMVIII